MPATESLKDTIARVLPYWEERIAPELKAGKRVLISAHGNSLRALVKHLSGIPDDEITSLEIPTGQPIVYELADDLSADGPILPERALEPGGDDPAAQHQNVGEEEQPEVCAAVADYQQRDKRDHDANAGEQFDRHRQVADLGRSFRRGHVDLDHDLPEHLSKFAKRIPPISILRWRS